MAASRLSTTVFEPDVLDAITQEDEDRVLAGLRLREADRVEQMLDTRALLLRRAKEIV